MMKPVFALILLFPAFAFTQKVFEIKNASAAYDVRLSVERCDDGFCRGTAFFALFRKGQSRPFQILKLHKDKFMPEEIELTNAKRMYDAQSVLFFEDYNFDGTDDLAVRDGSNGGYNGPSYQIYLYSKAAKRFIRNAHYTRLAQGPYLGMFRIDKRRKRLQTFWKSGCCMHYFEEYAINRNRPTKVKEVNEYYNLKGDGYEETETRVLTKGKWRLWIKREKIEDAH